MFNKKKELVVEGGCVCVCVEAILFGLMLRDWRLGINSEKRKEQAIFYSKQHTTHKKDIYPCCLSFGMEH